MIKTFKYIVKTIKKTFSIIKMLHFNFYPGGMGLLGTKYCRFIIASKLP